MNDPGAFERPPSKPFGLGAKILIALGGLPVSVAMVAITPVLPRIEAALAHGPGDRLEIKLLVTIVGVTMVFGAPLAGFLTDRFGARRVFAIAACIFALAGTAGLYLGSLPALLVSRLFVGATAAALVAITMTLINTRLDAEGRAKWMGITVACALISVLILYPLSGALGEIGWRWCFAMYGLGLPLAALSIFALDGKRPERSPVAVRNESGRPLAWFPVRYAVLASAIGFVSYLPMVYVPFMMRQAGVSSPLLISVVTLGNVIISATAAMLFGQTRRRVSAPAIFAFCFACTGIGGMIAALVPSVAGIATGVMVAGLGMGWLVPNLMTSVADRVTIDKQGRAIGLLKGSMYLAAPVCVIMIEPLAQRFGAQSGLVATAAISFSVFAVFARRILSGFWQSSRRISGPAVSAVQLRR